MGDDPMSPGAAVVRPYQPPIVPGNSTGTWPGAPLVPDVSPPPAICVQPINLTRNNTDATVNRHSQEIAELKHRMTKLESSTSSQPHPAHHRIVDSSAWEGFNCDGPPMQAVHDLDGPRYRCSVHRNVDLCSNCVDIAPRHQGCVMLRVMNRRQTMGDEKAFPPTFGFGPTGCMPPRQYNGPPDANIRALSLPPTDANARALSLQ